MLHNSAVFFELIFFLYAAYAVGGVFLPRLGVKEARGVLWSAQAALCGLGLFALAGLALALLGWFNAYALWVLLLVALLVARKRVRTHFASFTRTHARRLAARVRARTRGSVFLYALLALWLVANFTLNFVPITAHDTKDYHLPIVLDIAEKGRTDFTDAIEHYRFTPVLAEMLYAEPLVLFGEKTAPFVFQPLQYMTLPLFLALVYGFLRTRLKQKWLVPAALLAVLGMMTLQREVLHGGYVDLFAFVFGFAGTLPFIEYAAKAKTNAQKHFPELIFAAFCLGVSLGMKYFGFFFGALNLVFLAVAWKRFRLSARGIGKIILMWGTIIAALAVFWYAKNALWFGNPLYPMFSHDAAISTTQQGIQGFMMSRTPLNFLLFPFALFGSWFLNPAVESSSNLVVFAYFGLLYILIALRIVFRQKFSTVEILLFVFIQGYLALHFIFSHYLRYLLPSVMILPALLALLADGLFTVPRFSDLRRIARGAVALAAAFLFLANFHYFKIRFYYIIGVYNEQEYVRKVGSQ